MKKHCKFVAMALAGALLFQSVSPLSAQADNDVSETTEAVEATTEPVEQTESTENEVATAEPTEAADEVVEPIIDETALESGEVVTAPVESSEETVVTEEPTEETVEEKEEINLDEFELIEPEDGKDFNEDGISDLYTKLLCDGEILTADGKKVFGNYSYVDVQSSNDLDGDGLLNGQEVSVKVENGKEYAVLNSDPTLLDTDGDGINDADDTAPFTRGLAGGVVGSVRLVARHDESTNNPTHGHVYIVYTSYVNDLYISIDKLYGYYTTNPEYKDELQEAAQLAADNQDATFVSWRSTADEITDANKADRQKAASDLYTEYIFNEPSRATVKLDRGDYVSIGNYGMADKNDVAKDYMNKAIVMFKGHIPELTQLWNEFKDENVSEEYVAEHFNEILQTLGNESTAFVDMVLTDHTDGGVFINRELYNQKLEYDQGPNEIIELDATQEQTDAILQKFAEESYFNMFTHNCSTAAANVWNSVYGMTKDADGNISYTPYYVHSGVQVTINEWSKTFSFPVIVKNSIKNMSALNGYIGPKTYVTGKSVQNTTGTATKYDTSSLYRKKVQPSESTDEPTVQPTNPTPSNGGNNSGSNSSSNGSNGSSNSGASNLSEVSTTLTAAAGLQIVDAEVPTAAASATVGQSTKRAKAVGSKVKASEDTSEEEEEVVEEEEPEEETTEIEEEETPLAVEEKAEAGFPWYIILIIVAICAVAGITVYTKKRAK